MTTQKEMRKIYRLMEVIQKEKRIGKVQLIMRSGISISYYEKLKPFLEEIYPHKVQYDKLTRTWHAIIQENLDEIETS